jgi:hypothetical protein
VVHSTEIYVPLQLNQSPFNVGLPIQLTYFKLDEVEELARRYGLTWTPGQEGKELMALVGGHPILVQIALYHLSLANLPLKKLLSDAATPSGIYKEHLQRHLATLTEQATLAEAWAKVIQTTEPVTLEPILAYKLSSMGLVHPVGDQVTVSCELYRQYFKPKQPSSSTPPKSKRRSRGFILTEPGLKKLLKAKEDQEWNNNNGNRYTLEELSEITGLSVDTLMKIFAAETKVDKSSLKLCFEAFKLKLQSEDFFKPS